MASRRVWCAIAALVLLLVACKKRERPEPATPEPAKQASSATQAPPAGPPVELVVAYGSEKKSWMEEQITAFNASGARIGGERPVTVVGKAMGSGEAMAAILAGEKPHVFSPASGAYVTLLNHQWLSRDQHTAPIAPAGEPLVLSPVVIAMWKPMAEALGWPEKPIGWADILAVSKNPDGWGAKGRPEWGTFKLGHTHPEYSNSGLLSALAIAYAGAGKTRGLGPDDLRAARTRTFLKEVEESIVHYGKSTGFFADKMLERGVSYLSAAVLYENLVIEAYGRPEPPEMPVVAVYPEEGTFWSDHPYCVLDAEWVGAAEREAAAAFQAFLRALPAQQRALALGFRPADASIAITAPIDPAHGVDPKQPQTLLEVPDGATLAMLLEVWRESKKTSDVALVLDKSGSMKGQPLTEAKAGARAFLATLDERDRVSLFFFDHKLYPEVGPVELRKGRADLEARIDGVIADGGTALYDAIGKAHQELAERLKKTPHRIHAIVVMTDGADEHSKQMSLEKVLAAVGGESSSIQVFTIAYGAAPSVSVLQRVSDAGHGSFSKGDVASIAQVFRDVGAFF